LTLNTLEIDRKNVLMVGDRVATEFSGASAVGTKSVLVKTGEFKESDVNGDIQPDFIVDSVREIEQFF
jgi:ribonucleotide monophosphatase NagD (HAD superfamily)